MTPTISLKDLQRRIESWRANKSNPASRIPESLLADIKTACDKHGVDTIKNSCDLSYYLIKKACGKASRIHKIPTKSEIKLNASPVSFAELMPAIHTPTFSAKSCNVILSNADGVTLKIEGYENLNSLVELFLTGRRGGM